MPGFSKDLNSRFNKQWENTMRGGGTGNLANKRHSIVIQEPAKKLKKRKSKTKDSRPKKSKKY